MSSQTAQRPKKPSRSAKPKKYVRQTAHVEARRDGKPLIFGWGGHLSRNEKTKLQRRAVWTFTTLIVVAIIAVLVGSWININVIIPGKTIASVNGHNIPQSDYRKFVAVEAQLHQNKLNGPHGLQAQADALQAQITAAQKDLDNATKTVTDLQGQIQKLPKNSPQLASLQAQLKDAQAKQKDAQTKHDNLNAQYNDFKTNTLAAEQNLYNQSQVGNDSIQFLQEDQLIQQWLAKQSASIRSQVEPTSSAVNKTLNDFTANLPKGTTYNSFLSTNNVSDQDVRAMMTVLTRRSNMQTYVASTITSPTYQVQARAITTATVADANSIIAQLNKGAKFSDLANSKISTDANTKSKGGELGWLARYQYIKTYSLNVGGTIDNWLFDPARKVNEISPVLTENGTYHVVQIEAIDPSRALDATTLKSLKDNALQAWVLSQKAPLSSTQYTTPDQTMLLDPSNMPPGLPSSVSSGTPTTGGGQ